MKIERRVRPNFVKLCVNKTIGNFNKAIQYEEWEIIKIRTTCTDKDRQNSSAYDIKGK